MKVNNFVRYLIIITIYALISTVINNSIIKDDLYRINLQGQLSDKQMNLILGERQKYTWLAHLISTIIITVKLGLVAFILYSGSIIWGYKTKFSRIFRLVLGVEFIFLIPLIIKIVYFTFTQTDYTLEDVQYFYPLSLLNLFDSKTIDPLWIYPLQVINVFEIAYWFALAYGMW